MLGCSRRGVRKQTGEVNEECVQDAVSLLISIFRLPRRQMHTDCSHLTSVLTGYS